MPDGLQKPQLSITVRFYYEEEGVAELVELRDIAAIEAVTHAQNESAIRLYESNGFQRTESRHWHHFWNERSN